MENNQNYEQQNRPQKRKMGAGATIVIAIIVIAVLIGSFLISNYNGLVSKQENVNGKWADVQVQYQRRADLIPNLVETVKGYAEHESQVLTDIAKLRSNYQDAKTPEDFQAADAQFSRAINVVLENYPDLKANENFLSLQDELAGTENRISIARKDYNKEAVEFNKTVRRFPTNMIAGMFGFDRFDTFKAKEGAEDAPDVDFGK